MRAPVLRPALARSLGWKTGTLRRWDREGKGPAGRFALSRTQIAYPAEEVESWLASLPLRGAALAKPTPPSRIQSPATDQKPQANAKGGPLSPSGTEESTPRRGVPHRTKTGHGAPKQGRKETVAGLVQMIRAVSEANGWRPYDIVGEICTSLEDEERRAWNDPP